MFAAFYSSFWQHPVLLVALPILFLVARGRKLFGVRPAFLRGYLFLRCYLGLVLAGTLLDAILTADGTARALGLPAGVASAIAISFVIVGDFRVFWLVIRLKVARMSLSFWARAAALSLVGPLLQAGLILAFPALFSEVRVTFLVYEIALFALLGGLLLGLSSKPEAVFGREVLLYALLTYGLWIAADVVILSGVDLGYLVRVVPNVLYYGAYAPFVYVRAQSHAGDAQG